MFHDEIYYNANERKSLPFPGGNLFVFHYTQFGNIKHTKTLHRWHGSDGARRIASEAAFVPDIRRIKESIFTISWLQALSRIYYNSKYA